ncbi:hypothetical protein E2I00_018365 [Balaenoptera physalus]|uniref:Uncharacterized protein n=1 Tax=Balaenoptera physalus TaxID=9770 RepID=A0A6A1QE89_BALPH|nr:hypothetical protein E2I00_018365 [Balaenoptera physalus]
MGDTQVSAVNGKHGEIESIGVPPSPRPALVQRLSGFLAVCFIQDLMVKLDKWPIPIITCTFPLRYSILKEKMNKALVRKIAYQANLAVQNWKIEQARGSAVNIIQFQLNQDKMNFSTLRNIQGLFAPLKLQMEFKAVQQVQRLPFLPSSNLALDILRGNDETIGFEDILNDWVMGKYDGSMHSRRSAFRANLHAALYCAVYEAFLKLRTCLKKPHMHIREKQNYRLLELEGIYNVKGVVQTVGGPE